MHAVGAYPLLVVVPASSRTHWADEVEGWLRMPPNDVHVVWDSNSKPREQPPLDDADDEAWESDDDDWTPSEATSPRVVIISYNMSVRLLSSSAMPLPFPSPSDSLLSDAWRRVCATCFC